MTNFMKAKPLLFRIYETAKTWNTRPSVMLGITDHFTAFQVDEAVGTFGNLVHAEMDDVEGKKKEEIRGKRQMVLDRILGFETKFKAPPAGTVKQTPKSIKKD